MAWPPPYPACPGPCGGTTSPAPKLYFAGLRDLPAPGPRFMCASCLNSTGAARGMEIPWPPSKTDPDCEV